jgi:hypothetical protein
MVDPVHRMRKRPILIGLIGGGFGARISLATETVQPEGHGWQGASHASVATGAERHA